MSLNRVLLLSLITLFTFLELRADKLYLIKFGESLYPSLLTNRLGSTSIKMGWYFYYFEKESFKILIDSGMVGLKNISKFRIKNYKSPQELLLKKGISPDSITDIFITHSHFDHIEGVLNFPNAKIHIQLLEYENLKMSIAVLRGCSDEVIEIDHVFENQLSRLDGIIDIGEHYNSVRNGY